MSLFSRFFEFLRAVAYELFPAIRVRGSEGAKRKTKPKKPDSESATKPKFSLPKDKLGRKGEDMAACFLRRQKGYHILERNSRLMGKEIDIIAKDGECIVFVEVKTRKTENAGSPAEAVDKAKRMRLILAAELYLRKRRLEFSPARLDIIAIVWPEDGRPKLEHFENAFDGFGN